jgi:hypothetical protein
MGSATGSNDVISMAKAGDGIVGAVDATRIVATT